MMNQHKVSVFAALIILSVTSCSVLHHQYAVHAFVHPSPFASKYVTQRVPSPSSMSTLGTRRTIHPSTSSDIRLPWNLFVMTATASSEDLEKEISGMRVKEIRQELESYGISTKSFFEKSEMVNALLKAREEGKTPINGGVNGDSAASTKNDSDTTTSSSAGSSSTANRTERIQQEKEKCKKMKVGELKKELESYGVSTKSFFEKTEFVQAVAEARVDGPKKTAASSGGSRAGSSSWSAKEEPRDPSYRDVVVTKFTGGANLLGGKLIDVRAR